MGPHTLALLLRLGLMRVHRQMRKHALHAMQCWHGLSSNRRVIRTFINSFLCPSAHPFCAARRQIAGWVGLWVGLVAFYAATAILTAEVWEREWLPIGHMLKRPAAKKTCAAALWH